MYSNTYICWKGEYTNTDYNMRVVLQNKYYSWARSKMVGWTIVGWCNSVKPILKMIRCMYNRGFETNKWANGSVFVARWDIYILVYSNTFNKNISFKTDVKFHLSVSQSSDYIWYIVTLRIWIIILNSSPNTCVLFFDLIVVMKYFPWLLNIKSESYKQTLQNIRYFVSVK